MSERPVIVGVGNVLMGDDGAGPAVVEALRRRGAQRRVELIDAGLAFGEVLCDLEPDRAVVVVDAARGPGPAGSIYRLAPEELSDAAEGAAAGVSLHEVGVASALRLEALSGRAFTEVTIFGVEPGQLAWGEGLSPPVAEAVARLAERICRDLEATRDRRQAGRAAGSATR